ncbi:eukaryotic translation initiation factor 2-alpha kinase, putative [Plasmodium malariae]|uniref:Eukaryotic translation initiation factor 2-alpha kinase PK4 n=1 Tax=Plasmodium malariae TaxID=5858 RepID=A0A1D3SNZ6_PLAMA|nr:eukaryotic translation initiation factor 2-alpha kinase, putative [Plasmodium malariae]SCO93103.1 eukaryotic translation initiation factor 2-alpha kinase, putative [Plasmodium malariae]
MNYYNFLVKERKINEDDEYYDIEMTQGGSCKNVNIKDGCTVNRRNKISKNIKEYAIENRNPISKKCNGKNVENYIFKTKMNEMILNNLKNIFEKIESIEKLTNVDNYINMKNKYVNYHKTNFMNRSNITSSNESRVEDNNCLHNNNNNNEICSTYSYNRLNDIVYRDKRNKGIYETCYKRSSSNCNNVDNNNNIYEYVNRGNAYCSGQENILYREDNVYSDDDKNYNNIHYLFNYNNVGANMYQCDNEIKNLEILKSKFAHWGLRTYKCLDYTKDNKIYKRLLKEEKNGDLFTNNNVNYEIGNKKDFVKSLKQNNSNERSDFFDRNEMNNLSESEKKDNFTVCKKKEENIFSNKLNITNNSENILNGDDIIVLKGKGLNKNIEVFPSGNNLGNKNILFPYPDNKNKNEMNLTKYSRNKYFYGQYKYDESTYIYDLIVLDASGHIYKVSTDGTYYWKYKIVKSIHDYLNFDDNKKEEGSHYKAIKDESGDNFTFKDNFTESKVDIDQELTLKLRAMKRLQYRKYFDISKINAHKYTLIDGKKKLLQDRVKDFKKKNYNEKLKKGKNITKKLLSNYSGDLYYVNEDNEAMSLNINIKDVVNNSPFKSPLFPNIVFMGSRHSSIINIDYDTGNVIKEYDETYDYILSKGANATLLNRKNEKIIKNISNENEHALENEQLSEYDNNIQSSNYKSEIRDKEVESERYDKIVGEDENGHKDKLDDPKEEDYDGYEDGNENQYKNRYEIYPLYNDIIEKEHNKSNIIYGIHSEKINNKQILRRDENNTLLSSNDTVNEYHTGQKLDKHSSKDTFKGGKVTNDKNIGDNDSHNSSNSNSKGNTNSKINSNHNNVDDTKDKWKIKLKNVRNVLREGRKFPIRKSFMRINKRNFLKMHSYNTILEVMKKKKKKKKKKRRKKTEKRQLQISIVKWIIEAVDEKTLKKKWITTWVDVGSIFITDSHKEDISFINTLIEIMGNKLILRPLEVDKMNKAYSISKNINSVNDEGIGIIETNYENDLENELQNKMNKANTNVKSKIFIFSEAISSVFALKFKSASNIFTLDLIMKQNGKMFPEYNNLKKFTYGSLNFNKENTLFLPFSSNDYTKYNDEKKVSYDFDENIHYGKKILHRLNNISVNITSIEKDIRYLLSNIIFIYDKNKKIPINYIYKMKYLIREYHKTKQQFLFYLPGLDRQKHLSYSYYNDESINNINSNTGNGPIHICEYVKEFIDLYFEENEICFDYCSVLNIWDKIFNNYTSQEDCFLLSNLYRVIQNAFAFNNKDFNNFNYGHMLSENGNFLVKRRKKIFNGSRSQEFKEISPLKYKKGWYWSMFYAVMLIFVVPFVFIYRMFKKKKNNNKIIMKRKKLKDYDENERDSVYKYDDDIVKMSYNLLHEDNLKLKNIIREKNHMIMSDNELGIDIKKEIVTKFGKDEQPTLVDILARHARDSDSSSGNKYFDIHDVKYNLHPLHYWGDRSKYSLPNMSNMNNSYRNKHIETIKSYINEKDTFYTYRRRAASQDVTYKQPFILKRRIRSNYKLGNKYNKKNYTDNEKDNKKHNRVKQKHIDEKAFDKKDFINFLTNFNKKFMKKNSLVDHLMKINKTAAGNDKSNHNSSSVSSNENSSANNSTHNIENNNVLSNSGKKNQGMSSDNEYKNNFLKKNGLKKYIYEENKTNDEKKNKIKYSKHTESDHISTHKQNTQMKSKTESIGNNGTEKMNTKSSTARNLSSIQTSHIPYDAPLADFLENGRFMRTFENISLIGQGGFGSVYKVSHRLEPGSPTYAVKFIYLKVSSLDSVSSRRYFREIAANRDIYSKHVVRYYTWWCEEPQFLPMHILPKEVQNLVKRNKDSFKKFSNKNKKYDCVCSEKLSSWENKRVDLKNYKKIIKKKNSRRFKFYSDNDGLSYKRNDYNVYDNDTYNNNINNGKKKLFLSDKNFSDNVYANENIKNKRKKKKKKKKKIIYEEKQNGELKGKNHKYPSAREKINTAYFSSSFQEFDPFDYGYLSEQDRDLIVFADNDEPSAHNTRPQITASGEMQSSNNVNTNSSNYSKGPPINADTTQNEDELLIQSAIKSNLNHIKDSKHVTYDTKVNDSQQCKNYLMETNVPSGNVNGISSSKTNFVKEYEVKNCNKDDFTYINNKDKIINGVETVDKKIKNISNKGDSTTTNEPAQHNVEKKECNNNNKEKKKVDEEELVLKENADKIIKSYKKKNVGPEFSIVLLLQMELCKGYTLRKWLDRSNRSDKPLHFTYCDKNMNHPLEFDLFKQLIKGLKDIHSTCFIHRDLKPENIFVDPDTYTLKIGDLGLVRFIEEKKREKDLNNLDSFKDNIYTEINHNTITSQISLKGQIIGTPGYTAPEGGALCDEKADIYSAALILLELLCPRFNTIMERYKRLNDFRNYYTVPDYVKIHLNPWYILMLQMSKPKPADRPSAADLYSKIKVLLDPHLTDFAFSFNDINNDDGPYLVESNGKNSNLHNETIDQNSSRINKVYSNGVDANKIGSNNDVGSNDVDSINIRSNNVVSNNIGSNNNVGSNDVDSINIRSNNVVSNNIGSNNNVGSNDVDSINIRSNNVVSNNIGSNNLDSINIRDNCFNKNDNNEISANNTKKESSVSCINLENSH